MIQNRESLLPSPRSTNLFREVQRSRSPDFGDIHDGRRQFDALDTKDRLNTERLDKDMQPEHLVTLAHDCRSILQASHERVIDTWGLTGVWHSCHIDRRAQADDQVNFARR